MPSTGHQRSVEEIATRVANNRLLAKSRHDNSTLPLTIEKSGHDETARSEISPTILTSSAVPDSDDHPSSADIVYFGKPNPTEGSNFGSRPKLAPNSSIDQYCTCPVVQETKAAISPILYDYIDTNEAASLPRSDLEAHLTPVLTTILSDLRINLAGPERRGLLDCIVDDMLGYGPLQPLINDPSVSEILVNRPDQVFVERNGTLTLSKAQFQNETHVRNIAVRIANRMGRRVDEMTPMCDARLEDGSRVNIILPPLSLKGTSISIRKFTIKKFSLSDLATLGTLSSEMAIFLNVAVRSRQSILISGGTGSGKTTLLNAMSSQIGLEERVITIEDAAELQLQQPHVVSLETRMANIEGDGAIPIRDLLRNALRMRPDRIIIGEVRGTEAIDMLQAMNTGHEGSFGTIHANGPRDALMRLGTMVELGQPGMSEHTIKAQIASAIDLIVHIERFPDGQRRITAVTELVGFSEGVLATQDLFGFDNTTRNFTCAGLMPHRIQKAKRVGLEHLVGEAIVAH